MKKALTQSNESDKEGNDEDIDDTVLDDLNRGDKETISRYETKKSNSQSSDVVAFA